VRKTGPWKALYALAYTAGLRLGEALYLTWADVDLDKGLVVVQNREGTDALPPFYVKDNEKRTIPQPAQRLIFIDEGLSSPDAYSTRYNEPKWWDQPVTRHGDGTTFACADGHAEYHKWKGIETIKQGRDNVRTWEGLFTPATDEGKLDVQWVQKGIWGSLGYEP